jgi:hypothetical protein
MTENEVMNAYYEKQTKVIGGVEPCREMKWTGWRVVEINEEIWAIGVDQTDEPIHATKILREDIELYTEED